MNKANRLQPNKAKLLTNICGGLILTLPTIPVVAMAQPSPVLNPCPKIYYEEPFNSRNLVPEGCPPNAATRRIRAESTTTDTVAGERTPGLPGANLTPDRIVPADAPTTPVRPPLPENRSQAVAKVMPMNGAVSVKLKNNTNAIVAYEAVGYTQRRVLAGGQEIVLRNLPVPVTVTFVRQDNGFVEALPISVSTSKVLEVELNEDASPLDSNQGVLRIQKDGQVFLN